MKDPGIPSFRATGHSTHKLELNVYLSIIAFKLMTSSLLDPWRVFSLFDAILPISNKICPQMPNSTVIGRKMQKI